ncbi:MAG: hypothetical protein IKP73_09365 [Bacteroidales bacterium]|nr:hypothetical protein [Bacteroidales bacterium]
MFTINKNHLRTAAFLMLVMLVTAITSCKDDDDAKQTYNFLESFGPCPVARGGELTFIGKDLSSVQSVEFPGGETVTPSFQGNGKFTVTVPESAQPGKLILHTSSQGDIQTVSEIGYSEPVTVANFSPSEQRPGGEVTISGKYLNNATEIAIGQVKISLAPANDAQQSAYDKYVVKVSSTEIKFVVPDDAVTNELTLLDGQAVKCGTLTVTVPKFASWSKSADLLAGSEEVVMNGSDLDLISKITFANGTVIEAANIKLSATKATFTLPLAAGDGAVTMTTVSGVDVAAGSIKTLRPNVTAFGSATDNSFPYCDDLLYIKGTNLNLVKEVILVHKEGKEQVVSSFTTSTDTEKQFTVPELTGTSMVWSNEASSNVPNGDLYIVTQSGERIQVSSADNKLQIGWAEIGAPASYSITAGDLVTMTGCTNTAYMTKVEADGVQVDFTKISKDSYSFVWPLTNPGDAKILTVYYTNGDDNSNEWGTRFTVAASAAIFVTALPETLVNGAATLVKGGNFGKITKVTINGDEQVFALKDENTLFVNVAGVTKSPAEIVFVAENAPESFATKLPVEGLALPVVPFRFGTTDRMTFPFTDGWGPGQCYLPKSAELDKYIQVGAKMTFKVTVGSGGGQWQINNSSWAQYTTLAEWSLTGQDVELVLELTQQMVDDYNATAEGEPWIIMQGDGLTINYIELL